MTEEFQELPDEFWSTINAFLDVATGLEKTLGKDQIHSAFLYASSCYSSKFLCDKEIEHRGSTEELIEEYASIYKEMLRNGVQHYRE